MVACATSPPVGPRHGPRTSWNALPLPLSLSPPRRGALRSSTAISPIRWPATHSVLPPNKPSRRSLHGSGAAGAAYHTNCAITKFSSFPAHIVQGLTIWHSFYVQQVCVERVDSRTPVTAYEPPSGLRKASPAPEHAGPGRFSEHLLLNDRAEDPSKGRPSTLLLQGPSSLRAL